MITTFKLKSAELNSEFIEAIKRLFYNEDIEILIRTTVSGKKEDFKYSEKLLTAAENISKCKNLTTFTLEEFDKFSKSLVK